MIQIKQNTSVWIDVTIVDSTGESILLLEDSQLRFFYKKSGELALTQLTPLVSVSDIEDIQEGENFVELGHGLYSILLSSSETDVLGGLTYVIIPDDPGSLDFSYCRGTIQVVEDVELSGIDTLLTNLATLTTTVGTRFTTVDGDTTTIQTDLSTIDATIDSIQTTVEAIQEAQPSGISVSFVG